jgi:hypothetical protein
LLGPIETNADIVLNGVEDSLSGLYGSDAPCVAVHIAAGYHSPYENGSAVLLIAAVGVTIDSLNYGGNGGGHVVPNPSTPLVRSGPPGLGLWNVSGVSCRGNFGAFGDDPVRPMLPATVLPSAQAAAFRDCKTDDGLDTA